MRRGASALERLELRIERLRLDVPLHLRVPRARGALRARPRRRASSACSPRRSRSTPTATTRPSCSCSSTISRDKPAAARARSARGATASCSSRACCSRRRATSSGVLDAARGRRAARPEAARAGLRRRRAARRGRWRASRADSQLEDHPGLRTSRLPPAQARCYRALDAWSQRRVEPEYLAGYVAGRVDPVDPPTISPRPASSTRSIAATRDA